MNTGWWRQPRCLSFTIITYVFESCLALCIWSYANRFSSRVACALHHESNQWRPRNTMPSVLCDHLSITISYQPRRVSIFFPHSSPQINPSVSVVKSGRHNSNGLEAKTGTVKAWAGTLSPGRKKSLDLHSRFPAIVVQYTVASPRFLHYHTIRISMSFHVQATNCDLPADIAEITWDRVHAEVLCALSVHKIWMSNIVCRSYEMLDERCNSDLDH